MSFVSLLFVSVHVPDRNHPDSLALDCERNKKAPANACLAQSIVAFLQLRMVDIAANNQGLVKEHILCILGRHAMPIPVLLGNSLQPNQSRRNL